MFAALTIASLALGIGANSAMFGIVRGVLLQPLPYKEPDSLVMIWSDNTKAGERTNPVSPANIEAFRAAPSLEHVEALYSFLTPLQVRLGSEPEPALASQVTPGMFELLGRQPLIGQSLAAKSAQSGAVLSYPFWQRRFGGDPTVVGRTGAEKLITTEAPRHRCFWLSLTQSFLCSLCLCGWLSPWLCFTAASSLGS